MRLTIIFSLFLIVTLAFQLGAVIKAHAQASDPCPEPKRSLQDTPDSMSKVQEDIDRFKLCVERAQLLDRLNTIVAKNVETIDSVILQPAPAPMMPPVNGESGGLMNGLFGGAQNGGQTAPPPVDEQALLQANNDMGQEPDIEPEPEPEDPVWLIREISGKSGSLMANLVNSRGALARVRQGSVLPDDSRVIEITPMTIKIKKEQEILDLDWVNETNTGEE
jgi:hypothetical protein